MKNGHSKLKSEQNFYMPITMIRRLFILFGLMSLTIIVLGGFLTTLSQMKDSAATAYQSTLIRITKQIRRPDDLIQDELITSASIYGAEIVLTDREGHVLTASNQLAKPEDAVNRKIGYDWHTDGFNLILTAYGPAANTGQYLSVSVDFVSQFSIYPLMLFLTGIMTVMEYLLYQYIKKYLQHQQVFMENLISTNIKLDGLTEVMTRSMFLLHAEKLLADRKADSLLILCFVDLDDLKTINDTYGHQAGDYALKWTGTVLRMYEKQYQGAVGRYGGDEFVMILQGINDAEDINNLLTELTEKLRITLSYMGDKLNISCSIGAEIWNQKDDLECLIAKADKALYEVKRSGKGDYLILNQAFTHEKN